MYQASNQYDGVYEEPHQFQINDEFSGEKKITEKLESKPMPREVCSILKMWKINWIVSNILHYTVGVVGIICSTMAATQFRVEYNIPQIAGVVSAACFGILGFARPRENYDKFIRAWRTLDTQVLRYHYGEKTMTDVIDSIDECHTKMTAFENGQVPTLPPSSNNHGE